MVEQTCEIITHRLVTVAHPQDKLVAAGSSFLKGLNNEVLFQFSTHFQKDAPAHADRKLLLEGFITQLYNAVTRGMSVVVG